MCGIAGVMAQMETSPEPLGPILEGVAATLAGLAEPSLAPLQAALGQLEGLKPLLRREGSLWQLSQSETLSTRLANLAQQIETLEGRCTSAVSSMEPGAAPSGAPGPAPEGSPSADGDAPLSTWRRKAPIEEWNAVAVRLRDLAWFYREDILALVHNVEKLVGIRSTSPRPLFHHGWKIAATLSSLGRLEVRGRDSLGLSILVSFADAGQAAQWRETQAEALARRQKIRDFINLGVLVAGPCLLFTFKVAQEVGALGDNVARLQQEIAADTLLLSALSSAAVETNVFGHTRWASNGVINEQNCHPVTQETLGGEPPTSWIAAALNGDVDNYQALRARFEAETGERISPAITTDTKIIPIMVSHYYRKCGNMDEAFRLAVSEFEGSLAIIMHTSLHPGRTWLALAGSGQSLCVGLMDEGFMVASELYGVVELADRFVRMDGQKELVPGHPDTRGHIFILDSHQGGGLSALRAMAFNGADLPLAEGDIKRSEITTRDINRAGFSHYLVKEIHEAPRSIQRTLSGKFRLNEGRVTWMLDDKILPNRVWEGFKQKKLERILLMGQGTAAVAGDAIANYMRRLLADWPVTVSSTKATEFSGYHMPSDLSNTLVIAVSQSGTTTDTNRTIDLCRARGAMVIGIVNRRNSDLVYKVDGVLYTSDGRDIEMSVASTKAFYSQVTAGYILALHFAHTLGVLSEPAAAEHLAQLVRLPELMGQVLAQGSDIQALAATYAPVKRDWALAGSGFNRAAADEIRIKLSELCYKSIASDCIEDKKHIDLSSEPLVLVVTAGLPAMALKHAIKEVAIFKSHKSAPIVITSRSAEGFEPYAAGLIKVPDASEAASVLLNTLVGHLWGYYSALAIDSGAALLRQTRALLVRMTTAHDELGSGPRPTEAQLLTSLRTASVQVLERLRQGRFNSSLQSATAGQVMFLLQTILGRVPLAAFAEEYSTEPTPARLYEAVLQMLTQAISELSRPIDAIKHQAKTITVGISRLEEKLVGPIFAELERVSVATEAVSYKDLMLLSALNPAILECPGSTRYSLSHLGELGEPTESTRIHVEHRAGIAVGITSRTDSNPLLNGNKRLVVANHSAFVGVGRSDQRPIVILPLFTRGVCDGLLLLHVRFQPVLERDEKRKLTQDMGNRYDAPRAIVTEANIPWNDAWLDLFSPQELVTSPLEELATGIARRAATPVA